MNKKVLKATILSISFIQMGASALSVVLFDMAFNFPNANSQEIQFVQSMPGLFAMAFGILSVNISNKYGTKKVIVAGLILCVLSSLGGFFIHSSVAVLYLWSAVFGAGAGMASTLAMAAISRFFKGEERAATFGLIAATGSFGGMAMNLIGGIISENTWYSIYLVYLIALPGLILCLLFYPGIKAEKEEDAAFNNDIQKKSNNIHDNRFLNIDKSLVFYGIVIVVYFMLFNSGPSNFSLFLSETGNLNNVYSAILSALLLLGGVVSGTLFGIVNKKLKVFTLPVGFAMLGMGFFLTIYGRIFVVSCIGTFIAGASLAFVAPQVNNQVSVGKNGVALAMSVAVVTAAGQLGSFLTPVLTSIVMQLFRQDDAKFRMMVTSYIAIVFALILSTYYLIDHYNISLAKRHTN